MSERFNLLAWKAGVPHGTEGSNPSSSTKLPRLFSLTCVKF